MEPKLKTNFFITIKSKLIFMMIIISIIPLLFLGLFSINTLKKEAESAINKEQELIASKISQTVVEMVKTTQKSLEILGLANVDMFKVENKDYIEDMVYKMLRKNDHLEEIAVISDFGNEIVDISKRYTISPKELENISNKAKFTILKQGEMYIGEPKIDIDNQIIFELGVPIGEKREGFRGAIIAKISLRQIMKEITSIKVKEESYILLIDEVGELIGHSDYSQVMRKQDVTKSIDSIDILDKKEKSNLFKSDNFETMIYESYTGENVLGTYNLIPIVGWMILVEEPLSSAYEVIELMIFRIAIILGITILIIGTLGVFLIFLFIKPIKELEKGVYAVKSGNLEYEIPKESNDEMGLVIEAFNEMTKEIKRKRENENLVMVAEKRAAIGTLAAGVAHEINNPMNNLGFYATDLSERLETEDINSLYENKVIENYLEIIKEQIYRCSDITKNLLKFSRESKVNIKSVDISIIIEDVLKLMEHSLKKQNIKVVFNKKNKGTIVLADISQIQQMILNILTNAVDAMESGGDLTIDIYEEKKDFIILIRDTGYGIKDKDKHRIFDPFYTTKPIGKGTGLGLSISQAIVERINGKIRISSEENIGTDVKIVLPKSREED